MKKNRATSFFFAGIAVGLAAAAYVVIRKMVQQSRTADLHLTTKDLNYPELSKEELASRHLTDLNVADLAQLQALGLDAEAVDRLIENRPYRSKLELVSRMVLPQDLYAAIKEKIAVADAREPIKVAGS